MTSQDLQLVRNAARAKMTDPLPEGGLAAVLIAVCKIVIHLYDREVS